MINQKTAAWLNKYGTMPKQNSTGGTLPTGTPAVSISDPVSNWVNKYSPKAASPVSTTPTSTPQAATPTTTGTKGKTFLQKLSDILNFNQNAQNADSVMAMGALLGNKQMQSTGQQMAQSNTENYLDSAKEFQYIAERGASGVAKGAEGVVNALGYIGQMQNRANLQKDAELFGVIGDVTGNNNFKGASVANTNTVKAMQDEGLADTASFGGKYRQNVQERYAGADITKTGKALGSVSEVVGGLIPSAASNLVAPGSGIVVSALSAGGNAAQEALANGASDHEALAYGTVVGGLEAATEKMFDGMAGIFGKGAADDVIESIAKRLAKNKTAQSAFVKVANALGEGFEEFVTELGQRVANELIVDTDNRSFVETLGDAGTSALMGMLVGGIVQTAGSVFEGARSDPKELAQQAADAAVAQIKAQNAATQSTADAVGRAGESMGTDIPSEKGGQSAFEGLPVVEQKQVEMLPEFAGQKNTAPAQTGTAMPKMTMADFTDVNSPVWNNVDYWDKETRNKIQSQAHQEMVDAGKVVVIPEETLAKVADAYPDLRTMKKKERTQILNKKISELKEALEIFLNGLKGNSYEFEVNGNVLEAKLYDTGVREVKEKITQPKASMLYGTEDIFKEARYLYSTNDKGGDPNVYRWNYFYTPVRIGDEVVGVRIAVRDIAKGTDFKPESQIYNWGIKKDTSLDGGSRGPKVASSDVSSDASISDITLPQVVPGVKNQYTPEQGAQFGENDPENGVGEDYWDDIMEEEAPSKEQSRKKEDKNPIDIDVIREVVTDPLVGTNDLAASIARNLTSSGIGYNKDLSRNLDAAAGKSGWLREELRNLIERPFWEAGGKYSNGVTAQLNELKSIMDGLGIKKGSKESAAVQRYGEGQYQDETGEVHAYTEEMLKAEFPDSWENIVKAERYCRQIYDDYLDRINDMLETIYPRVLERATEEANYYTERAAEYTQAAAQQENTYNSLAQKKSDLQERLGKTREGTQRYADIQNSILRLGRQMENVQRKIEAKKNQADIASAKAAAVNARIATGEILRNKRLPKRAAYFRHFNEMAEGWAGLANILSSPSDIDSKLVGVSDHTKPKTKWEGFMQERKKGPYTEDAIGGLLEYIPKAEYKLAYDPIIAKNRDIIKTLAEETQDTRNANKFIEWLTEWTNDLAGKTNPFDRAVQKVVSRKSMSVAKWLSSRAKANAVVGNVRSATAQVFNLPNALVYVKSPSAWAKGAKIYSSALTGDATAKSLFEESGFLSQRYMDDAISQFDEGILQKPEKFANWMLTVGDKGVAKLIWASAYEQGRAKGVADPVEYADDITRRSIAGRGVGEIPLMQKATVTQLFAPFQIEVNNTWQLMKEAGANKNWTGLLAMFALSFLMNSITRELFGYEVGIDPINALIESSEDWDAENIGGSIVSTAGRLGGEMLSNMPFGAQISTIALPDEMAREELFGDADPSRFGTGNIGINALADFVTSGVDAVMEKDISKLDVMTPLTNFALPFGGKQVGRIVEGAQSLGMLPVFNKDGVEMLPDAASLTDNGGLRFAIDEEKPGDIAKLFAFGPFSTSAGMDYLEQEYTALGEDQTAAAMEAAKKGVDLSDYMAAYRSTSGMSDAEKRSYIQQMQVSDEEKAYIYRYSMLSSASKEAERTLFDGLVSDGVDPGTVGRLLMAMKDAEGTNEKLGVIAEADLPYDAAKRTLGSVMGTDLFTEKGNDTEYAKLLKAIDTDLGASGAIQLKADGLDLDQYLEFEAAGVDAKDAYELMKQLDQLMPKYGSDSVTNLQKYRTIVDSDLSERDQMEALSALMTDAEFAKLQAGYDYGVVPDVYVGFKEDLPKFDADGNGNYKQSEIKAAIDAMGIHDVDLKAALWQIMTGSKSAKSNPYSVSVGQKVYDAMH